MTAIPIINAPLHIARQVWREFAAFALKPRLLQPAGLRAEGSGTVFCAMALLHACVMVLFVPVLSFWQVQGSTGTPTAFSAMPQDYLAPMVIILAPMLEEIAFRGWLTGRPRALWLLIVGALSFAPLTIAATQPLLCGGLMLVGWIAMLAGWLRLRRRETAPPWYARNFAVIFYGMVLAFGLLHISNYDHPGLMTVPMVLPQLWCGLALGFVRLRIGLFAAILMHAMSNGIVLGLALLGN